MPWRTSLHIYVADEALQYTRCPRNLCCMKAVLSFKQLRSSLQVPIARKGVENLSHDGISNVLERARKHLTLARDTGGGKGAWTTSCHRLRAPVTVLTPVAHALHACPMLTTARAARCRACLPVRPGLQSAGRIVRVRRGWRRIILTRGRTHNLGSVPAAAAASGAFRSTAPTPAGTRARVRQDALAHLPKDRITSSIGEGALECGDCCRCGLQALSSCWRRHLKHCKLDVSVSAAAQTQVCMPGAGSTIKQPMAQLLTTDTGTSCTSVSPSTKRACTRSNAALAGPCTAPPTGLLQTLGSASAASLSVSDAQASPAQSRA